MGPGGGGVWEREMREKMKVELGGMSVVVAAGVVRLFWGDLSRTLSRTLSRRDERTEKREEE